MAVNDIDLDEIEEDLAARGKAQADAPWTPAPKTATPRTRTCSRAAAHPGRHLGAGMPGPCDPGVGRPGVLPGMAEQYCDFTVAARTTALAD